MFDIEKMRINVNPISANILQTAKDQNLEVTRITNFRN